MADEQKQATDAGNNAKSKHLLVTLGERKFKQGVNRKEPYPFLNDATIDLFLNDLENTPHAFVLACLMDRQCKAERAWCIPYKIKEILGGFSICTLKAVSLEDYQNIFQTNRLHRFNKDMSEVFYYAVQRIWHEYEGDVSKIWAKKPSSAKVVYDFLQFKGSGVKIATMAANILARDLHVPFSDYYSIDISPDVHIKRVLKRTGLVSSDADNDSVIYKAREMNPEFPGIIDYSCWEIGRNWCHPSKPDCNNCAIRSACGMVI